MTRIRQWSVQRPNWARVPDRAVGSGALPSCLGYCASLLYVVPVMLWLMRRFGQTQGLKPCTIKAKLCLRETGRWELTQSNTQHILSLVHAWPASAWITLRFHDLGVPGRKKTMRELTIWKSSLSPDAWRQLNVVIASQSTASGTTAGRGAQ